MKKPYKFIAATLAVFFFSIAIFGQANPNSPNMSITAKSVGDIQLEMSLPEAIGAMSGASFSHYDCDCTGDFDSVGVRDGNKFLMTLGLDIDGKITRISARDASFYLANGVRPGTTIAELERIYGKVVDIATTYDRETAEFSNHPKGFEFVVIGRGTSEAGDYSGWKGADPREKHATKYTAGSYVSAIAVTGQVEERLNDISNFLITPNSAGDIRLGMTIAEARRVFKGVTFEQNDYGEEAVSVAIRRGETIVMSLITDQKDKTADDNGVVPIDETAKIESITFSDPRYRTEDGVHIGMSISDVVQRFGKLKKIDLWEYDGSEHAEFSNSPKTFSFTVTAEKGSRDDSRAGIYGNDEYTTTKFTEGAVLESITIKKTKN